MMRLRVSDNGHFLVQEDGSPLFPVADTAWEIAWRLNRVQVERYVQCRSDQGFNTLAMVAFSEDEGGIPNPYGKHPFAV